MGCLETITLFSFDRSCDYLSTIVPRNKRLISMIFIQIKYVIDSQVYYSILRHKFYCQKSRKLGSAEKLKIVAEIQ